MMTTQTELMTQLEQMVKQRDTYATALAEANSSFQTKIKEFSILKRIGESIRWNLDKKQVCTQMVDIIVDETTCENCSLWLLDPDGDFIELISARGQSDTQSSYYEPGSLESTRIKTSDWAIGWVAVNNKALLIGDVERNDLFAKLGAPRSLQIGSLLCLPIKGGEDVIGAVNLSHPDINAFSAEDERALAIIANEASLVFANLMLFEKIQNFNADLENQVEKRTCELKYSEGKYRSFMVHAGDAILIADKDCLKIVEANSQATDYTGYSVDELVGSDLSALLGEDLTQALLDALNNGSGRIDGHPFMKRSGENIFVDITVNTISTQTGDVAHLIIRDITHRRLLEKRLKEYSEHLEELVAKRTDELKIAQGELLQSSKMAIMGEMASGVAHEINNPIAVIRGYAEDIAEKLKTLPTIDHKTVDMLSSLTVITRQADRCKTITDSLLGFSRKQKMVVTCVEIDQIITQTIHFASYRIGDKNINIVNSLPNDPPALMTDSSLLEQVLLNLYINAMDAIKTTGTITTIVVYDDSSVTISIEDNGQGMEPSICEKIFSPFFSTKREGEGTGLGLSICARLMDRMSGEISVESKPGEGTVFTIRLPLLISSENNGT